MSDSKYSSSLQLGWRWNPKRWCWSTNEDYLDTSKAINPALVKFPLTELIMNMPEQWRRFTCSNRRDCVTMVAICSEPVRAMSNHMKLSDIKSQVSAYDRIEKSTCRRVMLKFTSKTNSDHQNDIIRESRHEHLRKCRSCFTIFTKQRNDSAFFFSFPRRDCYN